MSITGNCAIVDTTHPYKDIYSPIKIGNQVADDDAVVIIGDGCFIGFGSIILPNTRLGRRVIVGAHSVVTGTFPDHCVIVGSPARILQQYDFEQNQWRRMDRKAK